MTGLKQWKWNMSSHFKPGDPEDDYGVLAIAGQFICSWRWSSSVLSLELLRHSLWSLSLKRDGLVDTASALTGQQTQILRACETTPAGSASKGLNHHPIPESMFLQIRHWRILWSKWNELEKHEAFFGGGGIWCGFSDDQIMWEFFLNFAHTICH